MSTDLTSPLLEKYQKSYEQNSSSRIFAPLAESYRKLGLLEEAYEVLNKGIKRHPNYPMGHLVLANCYYDQEKFESAYNCLKPLVGKNRDNIRLQKLFAEVCVRLIKYDEALDTYKYLLFMNPRDNDVAKSVQDLEQISNPIVSKHKDQLKENQLKLFDITSIDSTPDSSGGSSSVEDWIEMSLTPESKQEVPVLEQKQEIDSSSWQVGDIAKVWKRAIDKKEQAKANEITVKLEEGTEEADESIDFPVITHTLVDLYCEQGHYQKAKDILKQLLLLDTENAKTKQKIAEIDDILDSKNKSSNTVDLDHEMERTPRDLANEGRDNLMQCLDEKLHKAQSFHIEIYEKQFNLFLSGLKKRAEDYKLSQY